MAIRVGINGVGRIGRNFWRIARERGEEMEIVAVNDVTDVATLAGVLCRDTLRGRFPGVVSVDGAGLTVDGRPVRVTCEPDPAALRWDEAGVDVVLESTGAFTADPERHLAAGARKVVVSAPSRAADLTVVMGINEDAYDPQRHHVVSNACCTSNCAAPLLTLLDRNFGVVGGGLTTVHAYSNRQGSLLDDAHPNLRIARAPACNVIPLGLDACIDVLDGVLPALAGRLLGASMRVPVGAGSLVDLVVRLSREVGVAEVNAVLETAAAGELKGYLEYAEAPLVSRDVVGSPASCVVDSGLTAVLGDHVRVVGWYDNEWGYPHRLVDLVRLVGTHG